MFSSSHKVHDVNNIWNYILWSVIENFGLEKWAKIERNNGKLLRVKTSLVDWRVYTWEQWVSKTARQTPMVFFYIFSWNCQVWLCAPPFFHNASTTSDKRRKLRRKVIFKSCLNLFFFTFSLLVILVSGLSSEWKDKASSSDVFCYLIQ